MSNPLRPAAAWARRHTLPLIAAGVVALGITAGGITYAVAAHGVPVSAAAPAAAAPSPTPAPASRAKHGRAAAQAALHRVLNLLATDTGQTVTAITAQLQTGRSLNDIAGAAAAARFETDLINTLRTHEDAAVAAGHITAAQEASRLAAVRTHLDKLMAEPGTTLLAQLQKLRELAPGTGGKHAAAATPAA